MQVPKCAQVLSQHSTTVQRSGSLLYMHHQQHPPLPGVPHEQPTEPHESCPEQQYGAAAYAFCWLASVLAAATPMMVAPSRAMNPFRLIPCCGVSIAA